MTVDVKICLLHDGAIMPTYAHDGDSGMDLYATHDVELWPLEATKVFTGVAFGIPEGYEIQIRPKSGYSARGVMASWGTVDGPYTGECVGVLTFIAPESTRPFKIARGQKIAQAVLAKVAHARLVQVGKQGDLGETTRGANGFGSSGLEAPKP